MSSARATKGDAISTSSLPEPLQTFETADTTYHYYSLPKAAEALGNIDRLPMTLKILLENQLRFASDPSAFKDNVAIEMGRNRERYEFLHWGQQTFDNFRVVPPGTGICHQVNPTARPSTSIPARW